MIYLDYAASAPPYPQALQTFCRVSTEACGNPGALHRAGASARQVLQESRREIARLLSVRPEEVFFTSGGTEANNWAVRAGCGIPGRRHIVCSAMEHSSVLESVRRMQKQGFQVTWLAPGKDGRIDPGQAEAVLRPDTALLCVQAVNNETGVLQDVDALAEAAKAHRVRYLCDAVQSFGQVSQNLHKADLISLSAHKLGGPRGTGCLVVRQPHRLEPLILGGGQEFSLRSGTENLPGIAGFAAAAGVSLEMLPREAPRLEALTGLLQALLREACPGVVFAGEQAKRSHILSCAFPGFSGEEMVMRLDLKGICASPGAACAARSGKPSHVLLAMGYTETEAAGFLRFSLGWNTTEQEIRSTAAAIADIYRKRR